MTKWMSGLRGRMLLISIIPFVVAMASAFWCATSFTFVIRDVRDLIEVEMPSLKALEQVANGQSKVSVNLAGALNAIADPEELKKHFAGIHDGVEEVVTAAKAYDKLPIRAEEKAAWSDFVKNLPKWQESTDQVVALIKEGKGKEANEYLDNTQEKLHDVAVEALKKVTHMAYTQADHAGDQVLSISSAARSSSVLVSLIGGGLAFLLSLIIAGRAAARLDEISDRLKQAGEEVARSSGQLFQASQQVSSGSVEGAASLQETVASLEELSSIVSQNAQSAQGASSLASDSHQAAERGANEMAQLLSVMSKIEESSKKIEEIIAVIDDIAFQTNLLALNAAVEAARAGEQGKGFAVVAEAVRNLSQRTSTAARDITQLIQTSVRDVSSGGKVAQSTGDALKVIFESVKKMSALNSEIATASNEQSKGIGQINKAMNELDSSTQQNAAVAEEVSASSDSLKKQAHELSVLVGELDQVVSGAKSSGHTGGHMPSNESNSDWANAV